jgi:hypothetical protein
VRAQGSVSEVEGSGAQQQTEADLRRKLNLRWGRVVEDDETAAEPAGASDDRPVPDQPEPTPEETPGKRFARDRRRSARRRQIRLQAALAVTVGLVAFLVLRGLWEGDTSILPGPPVGIWGTWVTDDLRYADRGFIISAETFELKLGDGLTSLGELQTIRGVPVNEGWEYEINYTSPDGDQLFNFVVHPDGELRLRNPPDVVWRKATEG